MKNPESISLEHDLEYQIADFLADTHILAQESHDPSAVYQEAIRRLVTALEESRKREQELKDRLTKFS